MVRLGCVNRRITRVKDSFGCFNCFRTRYASSEIVMVLCAKVITHNENYMYVY